MAIFLIAYDLMKEVDSSGYKELKDEMKRVGAHKTQYSAWLVNFNNTAKEVHDHFKGFVDSNDRLWVTRVRNDQNWYSNAIGGTNDWLKKNPPD